MYYKIRMAVKDNMRSPHYEVPGFPDVTISYQFAVEQYSIVHYWHDGIEWGGRILKWM